MLGVCASHSYRFAYPQTNTQRVLELLALTIGVASAVTLIKGKAEVAKESKPVVVRQDEMLEEIATWTVRNIDSFLARLHKCAGTAVPRSEPTMIISSLGAQLLASLSGKIEEASEKIQAATDAEAKANDAAAKAKAAEESLRIASENAKQIAEAAQLEAARKAEAALAEATRQQAINKLTAEERKALGL